MSENKQAPGLVILHDVILSFDALHEPEPRKNDEGEITGYNYKSNFLIDKDDKVNLRKIEAAMKQVIEAKYGENPDKHPKYRPDKKCLRDGDLETWDGYAGRMYVSCNRPEKDGPPAVLGRRKDADGKWIRVKPGDEEWPYAGARVNGIIRIWAQDNTHGKRINASVETVQFFAKGERFGAAPVDPDAMLGDDMVGEVGNVDADDDDCI